MGGRAWPSLGASVYTLPMMMEQSLLALAPQRVLPEWIDYNGHMNVAYYVLAFDRALDSFCDRFDLGIEYVRRTGCSIFVLETHVTYLREVKVEDPLRFTLQVLGQDAKRFHYFLEMRHAEEDFLAATSEQIALHVSLESRRARPFPAATAQNLEALARAHQGLARPSQAGHVIRLGRDRP